MNEEEYDIHYTPSDDELIEFLNIIKTNEEDMTPNHGVFKSNDDEEKGTE